MKKVLSILLIILLLAGLGFMVYINYNLQSNINKLNADIEELKLAKEADAQEIEDLEEELANSKKQDNEDIYEKLLKGDFSGVAGEYANSKGETLTLLSNGFLKGDDVKLSVTMPKKVNTLGDGMYSWDVLDATSEVGTGGFRIICPIGVKISIDNDEFSKGDTSKIRFVQGNGYPTEDTIYYKNKIKQIALKHIDKK